MKVEKVYEILERLKKSSSKVNENGRRLLKYIYQDIYMNYFDVLKEKAADVVIKDGASVGSIRYNDVVKPYDEAKKSVSIFLEGNQSIINYFLEMINDDKLEFIDLFFDKTSTYFDIVDNHFYTNDDLKIFSFSFNIYCMLKAYHEHKDNFDIYSKIVEDCSFLIDCGGFYERYSSSFERLHERKKILDMVLSCNCYLEVKNIRDLLKDVLANIGNRYMSYDAEKIETDILLINDIYYDYKDLKEYISSDRLLSLEDVVSRCAFKERNRNYLPFYCKSLLIGDRLEYVNSKLLMAFEEESYRKSAFSRISSLDYRLFEYLNELNQYKGIDSFISCMKILFDSDTYYEFNSKIDALNDAYTKLETGDNVSVLEIVNELDSDKHKKVIGDSIISFREDTMKPVEKDVSIFRRMLTLYDDCYRGTGLNTVPVMRQVLRNSNLVAFDRDLSVTIKEELERIEASRLVEERRQMEIRQELEELTKAQQTASSDNLATSISHDDSIEEDSDKKPEDKPFLKFKSMFTKKG